MSDNTWMLTVQGAPDIDPESGGDDLTEMSLPSGAGLPDPKELLFDWCYIEDVELTLTSPDGTRFEWNPTRRKWVALTPNSDYQDTP